MEPVVLIVDDNKEIIEFLSANLNPTYNVLGAYDGEAAMEILEKESVHLIISDIMMPVMNGFELCKKVKSSFNHCHIPIILLTAKRTMEARIDGLELGAPTCWPTGIRSRSFLPAPRWCISAAWLIQNLTKNFWSGSTISFCNTCNVLSWM
jgi:CheY-like chemotaxis protein